MKRSTMLLILLSILVVVGCNGTKSMPTLPDDVLASVEPFDLLETKKDQIVLVHRAVMKNDSSFTFIVRLDRQFSHTYEFKDHRIKRVIKKGTDEWDEKIINRFL